MTELLRWAMNNVSNTHGSETTIGKAVDTARLLGWPSAINETVEVPVSPPFAWNYSAPVLDPGGPGRSLGTLAEAIVSFQEGDVVEFVLQNARSIGGVAEFHPWHAHGHSVWEVGHGQGIFNADVDVAQYNLVNPVLRDTISLQPLGWVAVRFVADNPGAWLFHCHILSHQIMGIGFVMVVEPGAIQADTPASVQFCNDHYLLEGGEGAGAGGETSDNKTSSAGAVAVVSSSHWWAIITVVFVLVL